MLLMKFFNFILKFSFFSTWSVFFIYLQSNLLQATETVHPPKADSIQTELSSPQFQSAHQVYMYIRGLEQDASRGNPYLRKITGILGYIPRYFRNGIRYASGYGAQIMNDPKVVQTIEGFFISDDKSLGWYPIVDIGSERRPQIGLNFFFTQNPFESLVRGKFTGTRKYKTEARVAWRIQRKSRIWRLMLRSYMAADDDQEFYGFGFNPRLDARSYFNPETEEEFGRFYARQYLLQLLAGVRPSGKWEFFLSTQLQKREFEELYAASDFIGNVFDLEKLGIAQHPIQYLYHEISLRYDSRKKNVYDAPGTRIESYLGLADGIGQDLSRFVKVGIDIQTSVPVILKNRMLKPRFAFNYLKNLKSEIPVAFTEYPVHQAFRGVSKRKLLRTDKYSFVPSIEYQWPLSFNLSGAIFLDYLVVTNSLGYLPFADAPWAVGLAINFHSIDGELANMHFAAGSEGLRFSLNIGWENILK